jgi:hypothetical protein
VAWMRMMGAESVAYHRETIIERGDDFLATSSHSPRPQDSDGEPGRTMPEVIKQVGGVGALKVTLLVALLLGFSVAAVMVGNRFGATSGGIVGIFIGPLVLIAIVKSMIGSNPKPRSRSGK